ncbi:MAG: sigma-70 family RNA polymerase sigma factor [Planctomycetes bacterium]|nr:sigma-70 family RNA polymerase sigma factor [Planctomycetota bacterium]
MHEPDLTRLLNDAARGAPGAADALLPLVYEQLRVMARSLLRGDRATIEPTALVHEAWQRLAGAHDPRWNHRGHFFGAASRAMRRLLVDMARARQRRPVRDEATPEVASLPIPLPDPALVLDLDAALCELEARRPREAQVVTLRWFGGLELHEIAAALGVSLGTVERDWRLARARLQRLLPGHE